MLHSGINPLFLADSLPLEMRFTFLFSLCLGSVLVAHAQPDSTHHRKVRLSPLPVVYYSPETRLGFGALVAANFETSSKPDSTTTSSYAQLYGLYTINKQYDFGLLSRIYGPGNKYIFNIRAGYSYFPEFYFGLNTNDPGNLKDTINYNRISLDTRLFIKKKRGVYLGGAVRLNSIYNITTGNESGSLAVTKPVGYNDYYVLGLGPGITFETRDNQVYPRKGHFIEILTLMYPGWNQTSYGYFNFRLDARKFFPLKIISDNDVLAVQFYANINTGTVPFKDMADVGGSNVMRGYYTGFYRYNNLYSFQAEYRATIWKRLGFAAWLGAALTSEKWYQPFHNQMRPNGGIGLRIMINTKDKLNIRVDQGYGNKGQKGLYLDISEAF